MINRWMLFVLVTVVVVTAVATVFVVLKVSDSPTRVPPSTLPVPL